MGWGTGEHEGYADQKRPDGRWSGATHRGEDPDAVAYQAVCTCGWRSEREHPVPPRPANAARDERHVSHGPAWEAWIRELDKRQDACWEDWNAEHFEPLLGYEPHQQLILAEDDGGRRHFLDGRPSTPAPRSNCSAPTGTGSRSATSGHGTSNPPPPTSRSARRPAPNTRTSLPPPASRCPREPFCAGPSATPRTSPHERSHEPARRRPRPRATPNRPAAGATVTRELVSPLAPLFAGFVATLANAPSTQQTYRRALARFLAWLGPNADPDQITLRTISAYQARAALNSLLLSGPVRTTSSTRARRRSRAPCASRAPAPKIPKP